MKRFYLGFWIFVFILGGCSYTPPEPISVEPSQEKISYLSDVKPILDRRCVTCHSCYNSPCQAKFSSFDGIDRGGSKEKVYLAERLFPQRPTRLFIDAKSTEEWREKDFFSLTQNTSEEGFNNSIMGHMLYDKKKNPEIIGDYAPEYDEWICPKNLEELGEYQEKHPNHGMPYGFPALSEKEYGTIMQWLVQGAQGPSEAEQKALETPTTQVKPEIDKWEHFLNMPDAKHQVTARYIYEHYFLAHLNFSVNPKEFFRLVRSTTPPGEPIDEIATRRPYDDPKVEKFYYRMQKIYSTIVHKTHIVVQIDDTDLGKIQKHFIDLPWPEEPHVMGYEKKESANPFITYAQIPVKSRYDFLLNDSEYYVRTFIRGPVCKGQIALNVIHDHFWVYFQDPKYDIGVQEPQFLIDQAHNLSMPIEAGSSERIYRVFSDRYRDRYEKYYRAKTQKVAEKYPQGWPIEAIWKGKEGRNAPALTVYRHFDSASVHKGVVGELPRTMWVIDYPQFERIYYSLVAGFDVFGNVSHQTNIRRYMDFLRLEGEINFILYMPKEKRNDIFSSWYIGDAIVEDVHNDNELQKISSQIGNTIAFKTDQPKQEFTELLVDTHFLKETGIAFDEVNYFRIGEKIPQLPDQYKTDADFDQAVKAITAPGTGFIRRVVDTGVNVAYLKVRMNDGNTRVSSIVVNRWHDNVNSLFGEEKRRNPAKDSLDVFRGTLSSYPNVFFDIKEDDLPDFFDLLMNFEENEEYIDKIRKYGISRSDEKFWDYYDWFQDEFYKADPLNAGLYDLNRYYRSPWDKK